MPFCGTGNALMYLEMSTMGCICVLSRIFLSLPNRQPTHLVGYTWQNYRLLPKFCPHSIRFRTYFRHVSRLWVLLCVVLGRSSVLERMITQITGHTWNLYEPYRSNSPGHVRIVRNVLSGWFPMSLHRVVCASDIDSLVVSR